jgi:hypothetical protein
LGFFILKIAIFSAQYLRVRISGVAHYARRKYQKPEPQGLGLFHFRILLSKGFQHDKKHQEPCVAITRKKQPQ